MATLKKVLLISMLLNSLMAYSQSNISNQTLNSRRMELCTLDILTAGIIGGVGSIINKHPNQTKFQAFKKGFVKASVGGFVSFTAKYNSFRVAEGNWGYTYLNRSLNCLGASMIENASANKPILSNIGVDYGFVRIDISTNKSISTRVRLQPFALGGFISAYILSKGDLSIINSIKYATPYFKSDLYIDGTALTNSILVDKNNPTSREIAAHEENHTFQQREYYSISNLYMKNNNKYIYWDMPNLLGSYGINSLASMTVFHNNYYKQYYEYEAEFLANRGISKY